MEDNEKTTTSTKSKSKPERVTVKLIGAGSCTFEGVTLRKNDVIELDSAQADRFIKTGLYVKA